MQHYANATRVIRCWASEKRNDQHWESGGVRDALEVILHVLVPLAKKGIKISVTINEIMYVEILHSFQYNCKMSS